MILKRKFFIAILRNVCLLGETGIGKSTLMDCLFKTAFEGACNDLVFESSLQIPHKLLSLFKGSEVSVPYCR